MSKDRQQRREQLTTVGEAYGSSVQVPPSALVLLNPPPPIEVNPQGTSKSIDEIIAQRRFEEDGLRRVAPGDLIEMAPGESIVLETGEHVFLGGRFLVKSPTRATRSDDCLTFGALYGCSVDVQALAPDGQPAPPKPPANVPKAVHHLRRAANALPMVRDPIGEAMQKVAVALLEDPTISCHDNARRILPGIAAALDLDVHADVIAKDVRAAIEALS